MKCRLCGWDWTLDKTVEIVILAMIAAFLGLRLYSVLGRRAEREEQPLPPRFEPKEPRLDARRGPLADAGSSGAAAPKIMVPGVTPAIERGIREIAAADRHFDMLAFVEGAKGAYKMVLEAFWRGDREALAQLCDGDVPRILHCRNRRARGGWQHGLTIRLVRIEDAVIVAANYQAPMARIAVRFTADIAAVTRNAEGRVIAGSLNDAVETCDLWTFSRSVQSASPDWLVDETDEG
jgi:predicted lipid-binding transport protein (Tim44 family)